MRIKHSDILRRTGGRFGQIFNFTVIKAFPESLEKVELLNHCLFHRSP